MKNPSDFNELTESQYARTNRRTFTWALPKNKQKINPADLELADGLVLKLN